ncbi:hypothetical protein KIPB_012019 [Kipferlia bialata]|uniref:Uncharacterized protein n=1 Tax=Kipferlia bialata TaxID=797122 RepID=A0A9K3D7D4_9EUKA|nr:hypothetical protein KIPB_012019 [Kipferlia bialata]|eukprot:g12019.t1
MSENDTLPSGSVPVPIKKPGEETKRERGREREGDSGMVGRLPEIEAQLPAIVPERERESEMEIEEKKERERERKRARRRALAAPSLTKTVCV